jgi:hypothetical protein
MKKSKWYLIGLMFLLGPAWVFADGVPAKPDGAPGLAATTCQIRNVKHQELLRPRDANNANGTPIVLYPAQPWKCMTWKLQPAGESAFLLRNLFTAKTFSAAADASGPHQPVTQVPLAKDGEGAPKWQLTRLEDGSYKIIDSKSGKALTALKEVGSSLKIIVAAWENKAEQKWELLPIDPKELTM